MAGTTHTLGWKLEETGATNIQPTLSWPNRFSRFIGDKAYGLLIANALDLRVPKTTVFSRRIAPFSFGQNTDSLEKWFRTCPPEPVAGKCTTQHGWLDPFLLIATEDPDESEISSILAQADVPAVFSGAAIVSGDGELIIEGKRGEGESFMLNTAKRVVLPATIQVDITELHQDIFNQLGPAQFESAHDGMKPWIVQIHHGETESAGNVIVPGEAYKWHHFDVNLGLEALRSKIHLMVVGEGLIIVGDVGFTSHIAGVLREAKFPARLSSDWSKMDEQTIEVRLHQ